MERFEQDYKILLNQYKNREWKTSKQKRQWELKLEVMEEIDEKLYKERIRRDLYEKYLSDIEIL